MKNTNKKNGAAAKGKGRATLSAQQTIPYPVSYTHLLGPYNKLFHRRMIRLHTSRIDPFLCGSVRNPNRSPVSRPAGRIRFRGNTEENPVFPVHNLKTVSYTHLGWAVWGNEVTPTIPDFGTHCPEVQKGV